MLKLVRNGGQPIFSIHDFKWVYHYSTSPTKAISSSFMVDYLVSSLGFTQEEAINTSSKVSTIKSTENPEIVVNFLKVNGFDNTQIKKAVYYSPRLLSTNVEKTLKPKFEAFQDLGLSGSGLADALSARPDVLRRSLDGHIIPTIRVLKSVFGDGDNGLLVNALKTSSWFLAYGVHKSLPSNIALLQSYGFSSEKIKLLLMRKPKYFVMDSKWLQNVLVGVEEKLHIPRDSGMFFHGVCVLGSISGESVESKFNVYKSYGLMHPEILTMAAKYPYVLVLSEAKIRRGMEYFMNELGYQAAEVVKHPSVLTYSLEKRVIPRRKVMEALAEKGLIKPNYYFFSSLYNSEFKFFERFVQPFKDKVPGLYDDYVRRVGDAGKVDH